MNAPPGGQIGVDELVRIASEDGTVARCPRCDRAVDRQAVCTSCWVLRADAQQTLKPVEPIVPVVLQPRLAVKDIGDVARAVEEAGPPSWLIDGLWPADAYGVLGAEDKAGKTWALMDLAVSVATGTAWLGSFPCSSSGNVLLLLGEGGERATIRRLQAIAFEREAEVSGLGVRLAFSVPRLSAADDIQAVADELEAHPARLVGLDPLYLAASGGKGSDLYAMGEALGAIQRICQTQGSALVLTTHWNKTGEGSGAKRFTGVGPGAWGRVLGSAAVEQRRQEANGTSVVTLRWEFTGSEIPNHTFRMTRRVVAEDPDDLSSPLMYSVEVSEADAAQTERPPRQARVLAALEGASQVGGFLVKEIGDRIAGDANGLPLKARTIQTALKELEAEGLVDGDDPGPGLPGRFWLAGLGQ